MKAEYNSNLLSVKTDIKIPKLLLGISAKKCFNLLDNLV